MKASTDHDPNAPRKILVAVAGGSPAIVTETLWALTQQRGERVDEVRVITTSKGEGLIKSALLDPAMNTTNPGLSRFAECCEECGIKPDAVPFSIHTLVKKKETPLVDIRDDRDNELAADQICALIREWTGEANTRLFCSAAGGRKTMSIYLTIAMMLYGRTEDKLFHVLVEPEDFESCREFFHPYRKPRTLALRDRAGKLVKNLSTAAVKIDLAEIPFVKLRVLDTSTIFGAQQTYSGIVQSVQRRLEFLGRAAVSHVRIHPARFHRTQIPVEVGGEICLLQTAPGFIYTLIAEDRKLNGNGGGVEVDLISSRSLKRVYRRLTGSEYSDYLEGTQFDFLVKWIKQLTLKDEKSLRQFKNAVQVNVSRANDALQEALFPRQFQIQNLNEGKRGLQSQGAMYTINLPGNAIHLPSL